jgi:3-oxoacyl-[acyl-carrier protein] reductase
MIKSESNQKVVLVTGVSRGVGFEILLQLAQKPNIHVIGVSRNKLGIDKLRNKCTSHGSNSFALIEGDITQTELQSKLNTALEPHGKLDVLIHSAGAIVNKPFQEISLADLQYCYTTNVFAPYLLTQQLLPWLAKSNLAHVVNIGSMGGVQGSAKFPGLSAYSSSKGALITLTECLAEELKNQNIVVNCVNLGAVQTEMLEAAFPGYIANHKPQEIAKWLIEFALNSHLFMNGKSIQLSNSTP